MPTSEQNLVIVGIDNSGLLHIRIFNSARNCVTDFYETKLPVTQTGAISTLKQQIPGLLPPHVLTSAEKAQVIREATSIVGQYQYQYQCRFALPTSSIPDGRPGPVAEAEARMELDSLAHAANLMVLKLADPQRRLIVLSCGCGLSYREITGLSKDIRSHVISLWLSGRSFEHLVTARQRRIDHDVRSVIVEFKEHLVSVLDIPYGGVPILLDYALNVEHLGFKALYRAAMS